MTIGRVLGVALVAMATLGATACKSKNTDDDQADTSAPAPEDNPEAAPSSEAAAPPAAAAPTPGAEKDVRVWAHAAPPAVRAEVQGVAPGPNHFWRAGYYGWNGHVHTWYPGRWYPRRVGYEYYGPRWVRYGARWGYHPGHWYRR